MKKWFYRLILAALISFLTGSIGVCQTRVVWQNQRLSVTAENESMVKLLGEIAKKTQVVLFVSETFRPEPCTVFITGQPLDKALKTILKGYDVATVYHKQGQAFKVAAVQIYANGERQNNLTVMVTGSDSSDENRVDTGGTTPLIEGTILPGKYVRYILEKEASLVPVAFGFEKREKTESAEINAVRNQLASVENTEERKALSLQLLTRMVAFEQMQRNHVNRLESLYRATLYAKQTTTENSIK